MVEFLKAIPVAAKSPFALVAYGIAAILFIYAGYQLVHLKAVLNVLKKRRRTTASELKELIELTLNAKLPEKISAEQWLRSSRQRGFFSLAFAVVISFTTIVILALTGAQTSSVSHPPTVGSDSVVMGNVPARNVGDRSVIIGPTDSNGNVRLTEPMAVGYGAQAGPGSIAIGAGARAGVQTAVQFAPNATEAAQFVNSPGAVANFKTTERGLSAQQKESLAAKLKQVSGASITLRDAGDLESFKYREQLQESFTNAGWKIVSGRFLLNEHAGYGLSIMVADMKHPPHGAVELQQALEGIGIPANACEAPIPPDELDLYVGFPQQTDK